MTDKPKSELMKNYLIFLTAEEAQAIKTIIRIGVNSIVSKLDRDTNEKEERLFTLLDRAETKLETNWVLTNEHYNEQAKLQE